MWINFIILFYAASHSGLAQIYEGSGGGSGNTIKERFVESANDPVVVVDPTPYGECTAKPFPGLNGLNFKGNYYQEMFICPNGFIGLTDENMQNWPFNMGTLPSQENSAFLAPYWSLVDLSAFQSGKSKVRFNSYHTVFKDNTQVFNRVNNDVRLFTGSNDFTASWAAVITWQDVEPQNAGNFGGKNQFQAVIVSDESSWYVIYNYADIDWAVKAPREYYSYYVGQSGLPVMGLNAGRRGFDYNLGSQYELLPFSGSVNAETIDDYIGNLGTGRWIFDVGQRGSKSADLLCYEWYIGNPVVIPNPRLQCPPTFDVASLDRRFRQESTSFLRRRTCFVNSLPRAGPSVRCCYKPFSGSLIKSFPDAGSVLSRNPWYFSTNDQYGFTKCCIESNRCDAYYLRNVLQIGRNYRMPRWAWAYGDPHYENMDRLNYTFNGCGEFMFLDGNSGQLQIQVKFKQAIGAGLGTVISAIILKQEPLPPIQINLKLGGGMLFLVNGTEYPRYSIFNSTPEIIQDEISVTKPAENTLIITTSDGNGIEVKAEARNLVVTVVLDDNLFGKTTGLLGNWSGRTDDDFLLPNGTILQQPLTDKQIHFDYGEFWRLTSSQSLFVNTTADVDFICPANYEPIFLTNYTFANSSLESAAREICGSNTNCLFDVAATQSLEFGQDTVNSTVTIASDNSILENMPPEFTVEDVVFNMTVGEVFQYTITATDPDRNDVSIQVEGLPVGATATQSANSLTISWLVDSTDPFNLTFTAKDIKDASSELVPKINICACQNGGICYVKPPSSQLTALIFTNHYVMDCQCSIGYTGRYCESVKDFCSTASGSPCHPLVNCTNSPTQYICGACPSGYGGNGQNCSDIEECSLNTDNCQMLCVNSAGSFECQCNSGYQLNADKKNCDDIDECATGRHDCMHICSNTQGSYLCSCNANFIVHPNNSRDCIPKFACASGHGCEHICFIDNTTNTQYCSCNRGYNLQGDGISCTDANECTDGTDLCKQICTNTEGSYTCSCSQGYTLLADSYTCEDIDECSVNATACNQGPGEKCFNLPGGFKCDCNNNQGLVRINGTCQVPQDNTVVPVEQAPEPPVPTEDQINNAVQLRLSNFQSNQWVKSTDSAFKKALAEALTIYCNANEARRSECGLPREGFVFSELNVNRLPQNPIDDGNDALVSFYAVYPAGVQNGTNVPVPKMVLVDAWSEQLTSIQDQTGQTITVVTEKTPSVKKDDFDWPLVLGISVAAVLLLTMGGAVMILACSRSHTMFPPKEEYYERRRWSFSAQDESPSYHISGDSYQGFDEDGLPVEIGTNYSMSY